MLELSGYKVLAANHGREGYEIASDQLPDVIICDVSMPDTDGMGLFKRVRNNQLTKNIPVIFFSASTASEERLKKHGDAANEYVQKPFTVEDLLQAVKNCLPSRTDAVA